MSHARLSPSNHRWPHCPGSVREEAAYPDIPGSAAIDGTGSHVLLEECRVMGVDAEFFVGSNLGDGHKDKSDGWHIDLPRAERVQQCLEYIKRREQELKELYPGCSIRVESESKSDPGGMFGRTDWYGTADITISVLDLSYNQCLYVEVIDYKDGRGWVEVRNNSQLISYLLGKLRPYIASGPDLVRPFHPERVLNSRITVVQPKTHPSVRYQDITPTEVLEIGMELKEAARRTDDPDAPLVAGKWCQWCKHKPNCTEHKEDAMGPLNKLGESLFQQITEKLSNIANLTEDELSDIADCYPVIKGLFDQVLEEIELRTQAGVKVPGYAMLPGNSSKQWAFEEEEIVKMLRSRKFKNDDIYPKKLISPAAVLKSGKLKKAQKERILAEFIKIVPGEKKLTKVSRHEQPSVESMFDSIPEAEQQNTVSFF